MLFMWCVEIINMYSGNSNNIIQRSSALNCANLYNSTLAETSHFRPSYPGDWPYSFELSDRKVWHAFQLHALLRHHHNLGTILEVPHECEQDERLQVAMRERTKYLRAYGDPKARLHSCDLCCIYIKGSTNGHNGLGASIFNLFNLTVYLCHL